MQNLERLSLIEMQEFLEGNRRVNWSVERGADVYKLIEAVLKAQRYRRLSKRQKGIVRRFLTKVSRLSRAQVTRLIAQWMGTGRVVRQAARRTSFPTRYTREEIRLLARVDAAHEDLSGAAVRRVLQREYQVHGQKEFAGLSGISVSHIYNLRASTAYRQVRVRVEHTQGRKVSIAERRKPEPRGRPGYLRVDTVHQGHHDGRPGVFHINAVDTVTQWEVMGCVETISEQHLMPVLEAMLHQFPFRILGFHCDNGSEFINHKVKEMLEKLAVDFTKSRPYRTTDNALVEGKNGAVVRKQIGYGEIGAEHAEQFQKFYVAQLNPYLNYHRPCGFAEIRKLGRGKRRRVYPPNQYRTPYEKLTSLSDWQKLLKPGITPAHLEGQARRMSDTEAARRMQQVKEGLLAKCRTSR